MALNSQTTEKTTPSSNPPTRLTIGDIAFRGVGDLIKLLPTGTLFLFQFLNPLITNAGHCGPANRYLSSVFLVACGFSCCFSSFTDSYVGPDGNVYYGVATKNGLWAFSDPNPNSNSTDLSKYKLRVGDFAHSMVSLLVFAVIALSDDNTMDCLYPSFESEGKTLLTVLPAVVGVVASSVFVVFPNDRHGIGYPNPQSTAAIEVSRVMKE